MEKLYKKEDVAVVWNAEKCIHAGNCARGLSSVFNPKVKPWIQTENGSKAAIIAQVNQCPSGALSIKTT